ncbi:MAG: ribonuclease Z [Cytophagia bacterium]|nr:MAG: ribonuclease Z [Cytophagia bacterium]TAG41886.1 MAG: ribonuclease Z [Cytophagia bacterium]TAH28367.1 MAG: ribonuclease Z [Cytophagales bacterium]
MPTLKILGTGSSTASLLRCPSAISVVFPHKQILVDCGENTQIQMLRYGVKASKLDMILISHLHPDHYLGIFSLLNSMNVNKRTKPLQLFAPADLLDLLRLNFKVSQAILNYAIDFKALPDEKEEIFYEDEWITIKNMQMQHRIKPCNGFLIEEKNTRRSIYADKLPKDTPPETYVNLKNGLDIKDENNVLLYKAEEYTYFPKKSKIALCADTRYLPHLVNQIKEADILYHEATFEDALEEKAVTTFHSTTKQAATLAKNANVKKLIISHFSARYQSVNFLLEEAKSVFEPTFLAIEGEEINVN